MDDLPSITPEQLERAGSLAGLQRRLYANRYRFPIDRVQSIFSFLLLQYGVLAEYGVSEELSLDYSRGKPFLSGLEYIHFNLSHCKLAVACALSHGPVGVDVQNWEPRYLSVAKNVCTSDELSLLARSAQPQIEFAKLWTRKECYGKYSGLGILYPMNEFDSFGQNPKESILETFTFSGYALSYCAEKKLEIRKLSTEKLFQGRRK